MSLATDHNNNIVIGAGEVYLIRLDDRDQPLGERYVGDSVACQLEVSVEELTVFAGDGALVRKLVDKPAQITRTFRLTLHDITMDNLALFVMGETDEQEDEAGTDVNVNEAHTVTPGYWYPLGVGKTAPAGVAAVSAVDDEFVVATGQVATDDNTKEKGTDYLLDAARARFYIVPGGTIAADTTVYVDYKALKRETPRIQAIKPQSIRAGLRYLETPALGRGNNYYAPLCTIRPGGPAAFKSTNRQEPQQLELLCEVLVPTAGPALVVTGEPKP